VDDLRRDLTPYVDRLAVGGMSAFFLGSVAQAVGELALHQGDVDEALRLLQQAEDTHRRLGLPLLAAASSQALTRARRQSAT
jgi:3-phosphoglycerate kinase